MRGVYKLLGGVGNVSMDLLEMESREYCLTFEISRLETFKDWPFDEHTRCTPAKMAAAGFYHCPTPQEPDLVRCFVCLKELDGWDADDDPWEEHKSHAKNCPFVQLNKTEDQMTMGEYVKLEAVRRAYRLRKSVDTEMQKLREEADNMQKQIQGIRDSLK